uniref:WGS project CAEQ00000000 data, annotated contig 1475 n=1 Tax=Trypanosoma congolense (strain IL3000) TaxID=1068625 RepID=F9W6I7_TRYCI|nr:unnamed protein product [Trypanosoma congolense IL3000]
MFLKKTMSGVRDLSTGRPVSRILMEWFVEEVSPKSFTFEVVVEEAYRRANINVSKSVCSLPDSELWRKLCNACGNKVSTSRYGMSMLRQRLVRAMAERLAIEEIFRLNKHEIEKESIDEPLVVLGLPRCNGHQAAHVLSRSGLFLAFRQADTMFPSLLLELERRDAFRSELKFFKYLYPDFRCVRRIDPVQIDDDLTLQLMCPQSYAWGLLHGLDEYLLECLQADQTPVYRHIRRVCQVFQWYKRCGHFSECILDEVNPIDNIVEEQKYGTKEPLKRTRWLLFSPLAILNVASLCDVFPDMRVIWVHRALSQCIPSLCSSLSIHNSIYTGKAPSDTQLVTMGDKVLGVFGSGTEHAIDYFASFEKSRMVHWSNRDLKRHSVRLAAKTLKYYGVEIDRYRRMEMINGQTEYTDAFRPLHDCQMPYFGLHEGIIGEAFERYIYQFEEFAFEPKFGITVEEYQPLAAAADQQSLGSLRVSGDGSNLPTFTENQPMSGHFLQEGKGFK